MLETKNLYKDYISSIEAKRNAVSIKIGQYYGSQEYLKNCIINNRAEFEKLDINIEALLANPFIAYAKIKSLADNGQLTRVAHYVKSYVLSLQYLTLHKKLYDRLTKCIMPYEVYLKIIGYSDFEISKHILDGGIYSLGSVGRLFILEKERTFIFNGRATKLPVDWGNSKKIKKQLIERGQTPYDSNNAPNGVKWHTYHNSDFGYWFWWEAGAIKNRGFFKFIPSNFRPRGSKTRINFNSKEEILNSTILGNVNKMVELLKFESLQYLKYRRPEKTVKKHKVEYVNN